MDDIKVNFQRELTKEDVKTVIGKLPPKVVEVLKSGTSVLAGAFIRDVLVGIDVEECVVLHEGQVESTKKMKPIYHPNPKEALFESRWTNEAAAIRWTPEGWKSKCHERFKADVLAKVLWPAEGLTEVNFWEINKLMKKGWKVSQEALLKALRMVAGLEVLEGEGNSGEWRPQVRWS